MYSTDYGVEFFKKFNVILNALDNRGFMDLMSTSLLMKSYLLIIFIYLMLFKTLV